MKSKRILIDARPFTGVKNGYTTYTTWVASVLSAAGCHVEFCSNRSVKLKMYPGVPTGPIHVFGSTRNIFWELFSLPRFMKKKRYDVYFCGQNIGLPLLYKGSTRLVLGLLDMIPQHFHEHYIRSLRDYIRYRLVQLANAKKADRIVTISEASREDIKRYMGVANVEAVYIRQTQRSLPGIHRKRHSFVYVGGVEWRKKLDSLLKAFAIYHELQPTAQLTLIGHGYEPILERLELPQSVIKRIILVGMVGDAERTRLMAQATAVVFPSIYEGYGLPIAESFLVGTPVICGRGGSQMEIGGDLARYVDPESTSDLLRALQDVSNPAFLRSFSEDVGERTQFLTDEKLDKALVRAVLR